MQVIEESELVFRTIFENSSIGIALLDENQNIIKINNQLCMTIGLKAEDLMSHNLIKMMSEGANNPQFKIEKQINETRPVELSFVNKLSQVIWVKIKLSNVNVKGKQNFYLVLVENITHQKEAEEQLQQQQSKLNYSSRMTSLGEMANGIAHEINNPLSIIKLTNEVIKGSLNLKGINDDFLSSSFLKIDKTVVRIAKIIKGLRIFSKDASQDLKTKCSVNDIVQETMLLCTEHLKTNGVEINLKLGNNIPLIECRTVEISQIILNIINNAADALMQKDNNRIIEIKTDFVLNDVFIEISNNGPKILIENREKIFQPFFTTKPVGSGIGLGLSIALGIMESHSGKIELKDKGEWTSFLLTLTAFK